jgi:hypothetical protein
MPTPTYPTPEESLHRLRRRGWSCGEAGFSYPGGKVIHQVDAVKGNRRIRAGGWTPAQAWAKAVEAARLADGSWADESTEGARWPV